MVARRTAALWGVVLVLVTAVLTWGLATWTEGGPPPAGWGAAAHLLRSPEAASLVDGLTLISEHYLRTPDMAQVDQAALQAAVASLRDPYSAYLTPAAYSALRSSASGQYSGIGIEVEEQAGGVVVRAILPGTPAAETSYVGAPAGAAPGLAAGDRLLRVDGRAVSGMTPSDVRAAVVGAPGTLVQLEVDRGGRTLTFLLRRQTITTASVVARMLSPGVGYIRVRSFAAGTPAQFAAAVGQLRAKGMQRLVLDLRDNPGGLLSSALGVARWILPPGVVAYLQPRSGPRQAYRLTSTHPLGIPYAVLVNGQTASAAELLAGAIQDDHAAPLVGERTYGKGLVQQVFPLPDGGALRLTVAQYLTPDGRDVNGTGVAPDQVVPFPAATPQQLGNPATDPQLAAVLRWLARQAAA